MVTVLLVAVGGAVGAPLRYFVDRAVQSRHDTLFPWGTFSVNIAGSALFGVLAGGAMAGALPESVLTVGGIGFCGALTTYSAFGYETVRLVEAGSLFYSSLNTLLSVAVGLGAAWAGLTLASAVWA
ncbi:fluoride efflux transporter CrcB [soil metagenome]|jgi:CrcB protein